MDLGEQFGAHHEEMSQRLGSEGGFTYNPRKSIFETSGFSVATHPEHEERIPISESGPGAMAAFQTKHAETLATPPEHVGGWRSDSHDVMDTPSVYPPTGAGETAARYQSIKHGQEAYYGLHTGEETANPFHSKGTQFPEFAALATSGQSMSQIMKKAPEMEAWTQSPARRERWAGQGP
jgi:hypothetical protein